MTHPTAGSHSGSERRSLRNGFVALALVVCALAPPLHARPRQSSARTPGPDFSRVRELIRARLVETSTPSLSIAVARRGAILWEEGFGWADRENRIPADQHTMYYLASVS